MSHFDLHAFISYAHLDNEPLEPGQKGWVTRFHVTLRTRLSQRLGEQAKIWRDEKLAGNDVFGDEIVEQFPKTALLVSILTPRYLRSEWCTRELDKFAEAAARTGGVTVGNKSRVIKVVKTPLEPGVKLPPLVERTLGYEFYERDGEEPEEIDPAFGEHAREEFLRRVSALAVEMAASLRALAIAEQAQGEPVRPTGPTVFIAECGRDMQAAREQLVTDLRVHGYEVLPAQQLPLTEDALRREVTAQLERAVLAIHLVGGSAGPVPDGPSGRSLVALQNEFAAARSREGRLKRIIWLPEGTTGERPEHQAFIDALLRDASLQQGADLLRGDVEALKGTMHLALRQMQSPPAASEQPSTGAPVVHLLMTEADRAAAVPLIKALRARKLTVTLPVFTGAAAELREANAQLVSACNVLLLFYGAGDEAWKFHQLNDLRKQAATGAGVRSPWIVLAPPATPDKQMLQALEEKNVIDLLAGLSDAVLDPLVAALSGKVTIP